jgi:hypothetical protein
MLFFMDDMWPSKMNFQSDNLAAHQLSLMSGNSPERTITCDKVDDFAKVFATVKKIIGYSIV